MNFNLTPSQINFYNKNFTLDDQIWNQGVMELFPTVYSYEELNNAYNKLVENHDSLRVKLKETENGIMAIVQEHKHINYRFWQVNSEEELMQKAQEFLNEPTDRYGLLVDCAVFQTPEKSGIMINAHHIVVDGFSAYVMSEHVNKFLKDETFKPITQQYADYVNKELKYKQSKRYEKSRDFWLKEFSNKPDCSVFPEKETNINFNSEELNYAIPSDLFKKITSICNENEITPASFFNAVLSTYIFKKYSTENFTIGVPVLNRSTPEELNTIGLYMHLVPLVIKLNNDSFIENAKRIEDSQMNLFRHQSFTRQDIVSLLNENDIAVNQLFDIVSDFQEFRKNDEYEMKIPYANALSVPVEMHLQSFGDNNYNLKIRYRTAYFNEQEIRYMLNSLLLITKKIVINPQTNISDIEIISAEERQILLKDFNNTSYSFEIPENSTLYSLFETTCTKNPEKVCLKAHDIEITFKDFKEYAERIDTELRKFTDNKKGVIAVICERSIEMYGAIYGAIRTGNAYLPIDPDYPQDRIDYILKNADAKAVVTQNKFCHLAGNVPCVNATEILNNKNPVDKTEYIANENDTAYVIYTSGSTGNPKGAKISHKSAINRILWMHDKYPLNENGVILQKTPYTFDVSVWEIFWWGILGGCLVASKPKEHFLPAKILDEVFKNKVTHLHFVPSVFDLFLTYLESHKEECFKFESAERVFLSGEALSASLISRFYKLFDYEKVKLHNLYGPTECAVDVTYYDCTPDILDPVPIGKPIYNTQMYIVDKNTTLVPIGVKGELCIGGANVGQGYLNNPQLTAEKFIDNPFGEGKLYKTGDLAYWREDGQIIFCGRIDNQIKLNGQRIETGEIEAVINSLDEVDGVTVMLGKPNGKDTLIAFCCCDGTLKEKIQEICAEKLPVYMIPKAFVFIDEMPLNPSGKLDRKKLLSLNITIEEEYLTPPQNAEEERICNLFCETLGLKEIGRNSDFFDLGGTSLSMISALSSDILKNISAPEFIENSTPGKLASLLSTKQRKSFKYIKALRQVSSPSKAFILFPYAGGGAESYALFTKSFEQRFNDCSLYYIDYLHSYEECQSAAKEIAELSKNNDLFFYSHCAGSAVAMQILNIIEEKNLCNIKHYIAAASIPLKKPTKKNIWNLVPDIILKAVLKNAGADFIKLEKKHLSALLQKFRKDTDFMTSYFYNRNNKIQTPVSLIISKSDLFTKNYKNAEILWAPYVNTLLQIQYIETDSHYFQSNNSDELINIIKRIIK